MPTRVFKAEGNKGNNVGAERFQQGSGVVYRLYANLIPIEATGRVGIVLRSRLSTAGSLNSVVFLHYLVEY